MKSFYWIFLSSDIFGCFVVDFLRIITHTEGFGGFVGFFLPSIFGVFMWILISKPWEAK